LRRLMPFALRLGACNRRCERPALRAATLIARRAATCTFECLQGSGLECLQGQRTVQVGMLSRTLKSTSPFTVSLAIFGKRARQCETSSSNTAKLNGSKRRTSPRCRRDELPKPRSSCRAASSPPAAARIGPQSTSGIASIFSRKTVFSESIKPRTYKPKLGFSTDSCRRVPSITLEA
jgi:hypothetical protein